MRTNGSYSPLRYPGGKSLLYQFMSNLIKENGLYGCPFAEPYAGGAGLSLRLLIEGVVSKIYLNDLDRSIYAFWHSILHQPKEFCAWIDSTEISVETWKKHKLIQKEKASADLFELGTSTFFLNRTNVSGVLSGGVIGGLEQKGKYKIGERFNKKNLIEKITLIADHKANIELSNLDALEFLSKMNRKRSEVLIYLDPPYCQKGADLYLNFYKQKDHTALAEFIKSLKKRWVLSYDDDLFIASLYKDLDTIRYLFSQSTSNRVGSEILVFPNSINYANCLSYLKQAI